jgi:hypothetical protein
MNKYIQSGLIAAIALLLTLTAGCSKQAAVQDEAAEPSAAVQETGSTSASTLPGANDVVTALDRKDYEGAIGGLMKLRQSVRTQQQEEQYAIVVDEAKMRLLEQAPYDPKAAEALRVLRRFTGGR